jgi:hypothetical protein
MDRGDMWTDKEIDAVIRNYPRYGCNTSKWDYEIDRSTKAIQVKARRLGIYHYREYSSKLTPSEQKKLMDAIEIMCQAFSLTRTQLMREASRLIHGQS